MGIIEGGCLEALHVILGVGKGRNLVGRCGDSRDPDSKPPVQIPFSYPRQLPHPFPQLLVQAHS